MRRDADAGPTLSGSLLNTIWRRLPMNGWLLWGLILPVLLVIAGVITLRRRKGRR
jgi:hypothetical protein